MLPAVAACSCTLAKLRHAERSSQVERVHAVEVRVVVLLGAELADGATAQREVHARLDRQRIVSVEERLQRCHELARVCTHTHQVWDGGWHFVRAENWH
eukprot:365800-Chlamydomonas_euryale.AAC.15